MSQPVLTQMRMRQVCAWRGGTMGARIKASGILPASLVLPKQRQGVRVRDVQIQLARMFRGGCRGDSGMDSGTVAETKTPRTSIPVKAGTVKGAVKKKG